MKYRIMWFGVALVGLGAITDARTIVPDKEKESVDRLFQKAHCAGAFPEAVKDLKRIVEDGDKKTEDRVYALRRIRDLACESPGAGLDQYLKNVDCTSSVTDKSCLAEGYFFQMEAELSVCLLGNEKFRVARLEELLGSNFRGYPAISVRRWAADELCNGGHWASLPKIEASLGVMSKSSREAFLALCHRKVEVLRQHDRREDALEAALQEAEGSVSRELHSWALEELAKQESEDARNTLVAVALGEPAFALLDPFFREKALHYLRDLGAKYEQLFALGVKELDLARAGFVPERYRDQVPSKPDPCPESPEDLKPVEQ